MKKSNFNVFLKYKDYYIGYNTLYGTVIFLVENLYNLFIGKLENNDFISIKEIHPQLEKELINKKFIIEDSVDEIELIRNVLNKTNNDNSFIDITINPTINCNFSCWYCYENHNDKKKIESSEVNNIISFINNKIYQDKNLKYIKLHWFGGEPLLHFKDVMKPILTEINNSVRETNKSLFSGITTNGYLINEEMLDFLVENNHKYFQITLDGNRNRHNNIRYNYKGNNTYDKIINNIKLCLMKGFGVSVRLNISEDTNLCVEELLKDFKDISDKAKELLIFSVHKVWQASEEVENIIESIISEIRKNNFNCSTYFTSPTSITNTCYADKINHLVINPNNKIYKCTARDYSEESVEGILLPTGNIEWNKIHNKRIRVSALDYKECVNCKILPICNAGCSQKKLENPKGFCPCNYDENIKNKYARNVLFEKIQHGKQNLIMTNK